MSCERTPTTVLIRRIVRDMDQLEADSISLEGALKRIRKEYKELRAQLKLVVEDEEYLAENRHAVVEIGGEKYGGAPASPNYEPTSPANYQPTSPSYDPFPEPTASSQVHQ